jgi:hypothetical protein
MAKSFEMYARPHDQEAQSIGGKAGGLAEPAPAQPASTVEEESALTEEGYEAMRRLGVVAAAPAAEKPAAPAMAQAVAEPVAPARQAAIPAEAKADAGPVVAMNAYWLVTDNVAMAADHIRGWIEDRGGIITPYLADRYIIELKPTEQDVFIELFTTKPADAPSAPAAAPAEGQDDVRRPISLKLIQTPPVE